MDRSSGGKGGLVSRQHGSVLILVLWILALLAFLSGDYLARNREKALLSSKAWKSEAELQAMRSVIELFSQNQSPLSGQEEAKEWMRLTPGGVPLWVKNEKESQRTNINTAPETAVRKQVHRILGDEREKEADRLADAILDWRDGDDLTRLNGAEGEYYQNRGLPYLPANGSFQSLTEQLLVRGMTPALFWGDPLAAIRKKEEEQGENDQNVQSAEDTEAETIGSSFAEEFTVYGGEVKRISIVIPERGNSYTFILAFLRKAGRSWRVFQLYRTMVISDEAARKVEG